MKVAFVDISAPDIIRVISVIVGALGAAVFALQLRKSEQPSIADLARSDRFGTVFIAAGALFVGALAIGNAAAAVTQALIPGPTTVYAMELASPKPDATVGAVPGVRSAVSPTLGVTMIDAPPSVTGWLLAGELLPIVLALTMCASAIWLATGLLNGRPFTRRFPLALVFVAAAVMVCGIGSQFAGAVARAEAAIVLREATPQIDPLFVAFSIALDLAPFGWGLLLGLLAGAFQIGTRLQRETELLV